MAHNSKYHKSMSHTTSTLAEVHERWYTVQEIAERLRINPQTIRRWLRDGELRGHHFGGPAGWRVRENDLEDFLNSRTGEHRNADR
jgi:excisionase family DNA binding protein